MIVVCIVSILITSVSSFLAFGDKKAKADYDDGVAKFQKYLNANFGAKLAVDGDYGPKTMKAAVKALQRLYNEEYNTKLEVDGILGKKTVEAIVKHPIKKGARNNIVKFFQKAYNCLGTQMGEKYLVEDGIFGNDTDDRIYYFLYRMYPNEAGKGITLTLWVVLLGL